MTTVIALVLVVVGAFFSLVAALGILRMPDVLMRMHAGTKAGTLGAGLLLLAAAIALGEVGAAARAGAAIVFLLLTAPVAAHLIGRAAYRSGQLRLWEGTRVDELRDWLEVRLPEASQAPVDAAKDTARIASPEAADHRAADMIDVQTPIRG
jgi:multicomponent Na+:H+ antiporter subunit G